MRVTMDTRTSAMHSAVRSVAFARSRSTRLIGISSIRLKRSAVETEGPESVDAEKVGADGVMIVSSRGGLHCSMPI